MQWTTILTLCVYEDEVRMLFIGAQKITRLFYHALIEIKLLPMTLKICAMLGM